MITQTPWIERKFEFNFPVGLFPVILERLRGTAFRLEEMVSNMPEEKLVKKTSKKWSIKEQVGHLYDLEALWYGRIEDFLEVKNELRAADMSKFVTNSANHNSKKIQELLRLFDDARYKLINKVKNIDESTAETTAIHPRLKQPMRLIDSLFFVAEHDDHHLSKIRELL